AASRGSECTSEEEDEFDNAEDEEKKDDCQGHSRPATPTLLGHEVMEERARFTVYKILVKPRPEESWVVFRRYTDFARLNDKLKETFPGFRLALPPKRWFKDNFDPVFLEHRQAGLQAFLQNLVAHKDVTNCIPVRDFLCLDEPPGPFDSLVESRAFCEGLEETNYQLQRELLDRQHEIDTLRVSLDLSTNRLAVMEGQLSDRRGSSSEGEYSTVEADQSPTMTASRCVRVGDYVMKLFMVTNKYSFLCPCIIFPNTRLTLSPLKLATHPPQPRVHRGTCGTGRESSRAKSRRSRASPWPG
uniref:Sorting nexin-16 n=1 Tax=Eptatretus burgeri TaxID=7764 RepID=A0A8C4QED9_EPTBU